MPHMAKKTKQEKGRLFLSKLHQNTQVFNTSKLLDQFIMFNKMIITSYDVMNLFSIQLDWQPAEKEIETVREQKYTRDQANGTS